MDAFLNIPRKGEMFTVVIDVADYEDIKQFKWHIAKCSNFDRKPKYYARRNVKRNDIWTSEYMHIRIMNPMPGYVVDHRDGNGLNNRRSSNLFVTTQPDNATRQNHGMRRRAAKAADYGDLI